MTLTGVRSYLQLSAHVFNTEFQSAAHIHLELAIETINDIFRSIVPVYCSLMEAAKTYPAPWDYAHYSVWSEWQKDDTAILCLRPTDKQGRLPPISAPGKDFDFK